MTTSPGSSGPQPAFPRGVGPLPRDVPGYAAAVAAGLTPARPATPPALLPGPTAHQALVRCGIALGAGGLLCVVTLLASPTENGQASWLGVLMIWTATAAAVGLLIKQVRRFRQVLLAELAAGYVTTTFHQGMFWFAKRPGGVIGNDVTGWVWNGVWVLTSDGQVRSVPDPRVDPPGFYPSPHTPGRLELWTGAQWVGVHPATRQ